MVKKYIRWLILFVLILVIWFVVAPPRFWLNWTHSTSATADVGAQLVEEHQCQNCHRINGSGALVGPNLDNILNYADPLVMRMWLRDPKSMKSNSPMPNFHLSDSEIEAIMAYLESIQTP